MTRYDPFAWGAVRLDSDKQNQNGGSPPDTEDLLPADGEAVKQVPSAKSSWSLLDEDVGGLLPGASSNPDEAAKFGAESLGEGIPKEMPFEDPLSGDALRSLSDLDEDSPPMQPLPDLMGGTMGEMSPAGTMDHLVEQPPRHEPQPPVSGAMAANAMQMPSPEVGPTDPAAKPRKRREVRPRRPAASCSGSDPERPLALPVQPKPERGALPGKRRPAVFAAVVPLVVCAGGGTVVSWLGVMQGNPVMAGIIAAATLVSALFSWLFLRG
jgi:hypothetical protein